MAEFTTALVDENQELVKKLAGVVAPEDVEEELRKINYLLKQKIAKQQTAQGEVADPIGVSPKEMKSLRKSFNKFDADGSGTIETKELKTLSEELAEALTEEEIEEGMKTMDSSGTGKISFDDFVKWISDERDKTSQQGMKMRMLKLKMRAQHLQKKASEGLTRTSTFTKDWQPAAENMVRASVEVQQGECEEGLTRVDAKWTATPEAEGQAAMAAVGGEGAACVTVNIQLLEGVGAEAEGELIALYDQLYDMANGDEAVEELKEQFMLVGKPSLKVAEVDGVNCLQITTSFTMDPFAQFGIDTRFIETLHARAQWAHQVDEVIKPAGEQIDVAAMEGVKFNFKTEIDRNILEWLSKNDEAKYMVEEMMDGSEDISAFLSMALCFGSADLVVKTRSVTEVFNKDIRDGFDAYGEFLGEMEERRMLDAESTIGMLTSQIVEMYSGVPPPIQQIYKEVKSKIAGPHSVRVTIPTANIAVTTQGLDILHKFFPTPEEIESHPDYSAADDGDDEDW